MRITGMFQDVYAAAKSLNQGETIYGGCPIDPVVRREGGKWMLESGMEPQGEDNDFECSLEAFDNYFYEDYKSDYIPSDNDADDFIKTQND